MRRVAALVTTFAMVAATASLYAQAKPSFAGTWVRDAPAGGAPAGGGGGGRGGGGGGAWGAEPTITQTATELSVTYSTGREGAAPVTLKFKLDGTDSVNQVMGREGAAPQTSKAVWTADKLVITTTLPNGVRTQTVSLVGGKLTIETNAPGREGAPVTTTATYTKKA
jgi:hypothetical protein